MADTIFALATAPGKAGIAVVRVSGPLAFAVGERLCGSLPPIRAAGLRDLKDETGEVLDQALVLRFPSDGSFTGEDTVEFQIHGSVAVGGSVLKFLLRQNELRPADPGEFTRRALENDRLDLAQVEGLADLIDAETDTQRRLAMKVFSGALGQKVDTWRGDLIRAAALIEATIDFADEDIPVDVFPEVKSLVAGVEGELESEISGSHIAERIRDGFEVAIIGAPNVGKSTLLNALAGREAAITSEYAGTTRDVIEVRMDIDGLPVTFLDTAGLRETDDPVENIGIQRAVTRATAADIRVFLSDNNTVDVSIPVDTDDIIVRPKADLSGNLAGSVSGVSGFGVSDLLERIGTILTKRAANALTATRVRHRHSMEASIVALNSVLERVNTQPLEPELVAEDLRIAIRRLELIVGRIDVEAVLDEVFSSFCIGK